MGVYKRLPRGTSPFIFVRGMGTTFVLPEWSSTGGRCDRAGVEARLQDPTAGRVDLRATHCYVEFASVEDACCWRERLRNEKFDVDFAQLVDLVGFPEPSSSSVSIPGLEVTLEAVSPDDEAALVAFVDSNPWEEKVKRRVQHYGHEFDYVTKLNGDIKTPMPDLFRRIVPNFEQCTVNEYLPGVGIASHVDTHSCFDDTLLVISLAAPITMDFATDDSKQSFYVPRRSKMVFAGAARFQYLHGIASRTTDVVDGRLMDRQRRISLTFRNLRRPGPDGKIECRCRWPERCDTQTPASRTAPRLIGK
eukprot:GEMP01072940.1.p1 GENE.GEMP01072940.1~~GEMP01072940.1.p1  ORF type:complete len:306 (+),score=48.21 GEMP01072940.1:117-1034(+)